MASKSSGTSKSSDTPKLGGKDSSSPRAIREGNKDPVDIDDSPVTSETGDLGYDKNTRASTLTDPWAESH